MTASTIEICYATMDNLYSWMALIDLVKWNFPGLDTKEQIDGYRETVIKNIRRKSAACALDGDTVVGFLLFSTKHNMLCHLAVHSDYRRQKIASRMVALMLENLDRSRDIVVTTFREEDEKGWPRELYTKSWALRRGNCVMTKVTPNRNLSFAKQRHDVTRQ